MSAEIPIGRPTLVQFNAVVLGAGSAVGSETILTVKETGSTILELLGPNRIQYIPRLLPASLITDNTLKFDVLLKRGGIEVGRWNSDLLNAHREGNFFPGFPYEVGPGQVQFALEVTERLGTPVALNTKINVLFAAPPQLVVSG